ncbi:MAG TPA: response regulator [Verrucomicrobiae bacterium]|nr:response regulator [Verrucomicrobiae bacterium]
MLEAVDILLVDDKPENLAALESILDGPEYRLTKARSAQEALLALISTDFALIVLDIRMPDTSGLELAQIIKGRKRTKDIPIIFLTAHYAEDEQVLSGYSAGAVDYLTKPINPGILKSKVEVFAELFRKTKALNEANRNLNRRNEELQAANQELEAFSYTVSHDLRAPLRHVNGYVEMLREHAEPTLDPTSRRYLDLIQQSAAKLGDLIDHFLGFAHMGRTALSIAPVNMNDIVRQAIDALQPETAGRDIQWSMAELPQVQADPTMIRQVWTNLLSNAVKYTRDRAPAHIEIGVERPKSREYLFYVRDNGVGFDMRYAGRLFGIFQRLHPDTQFAGTGIGLANVRRIIKRHGGRTYAEGTVNAGAKISFTLPIPSDLRN